MVYIYITEKNIYILLIHSRSAVKENIINNIDN